jgi:hypothetical protein
MHEADGPPDRYDPGVIVIAVAAGLFGVWMLVRPAGFAHVAHTVRITMPDASADPAVSRMVRVAGVALLLVAGVLIAVAMAN